MGFSNFNYHNNRAMSRAGSGRIYRKPFKSLSSSTSFDDASGRAFPDANNNNTFRRSTSTMCLKDSQFHAGLNWRQMPHEA